MNDSNVERKLKYLNLDIPGSIVVLPDNLNFVTSKDDLNYSLAQMKSVLYFESKEVNAGLSINPEIEIELSAEAELARISLNILITHIDPITVGIISAFVYDILKGKIFGRSGNIKLKIFQEKPDQKVLIDYEGPISGLQKAIDQFDKKK